MSSSSQTKQSTDKLLTENTSFYLRVDSSRLKDFYSLIKSVAQIVDDEVTIFFSNDGLSIRQMDRSRFSLVDLTIKRSFFSGDVGFEKELEICVNLPLIESRLRLRDPNDALVLSLDETTDSLILSLEGSIKRLMKVDFPVLICGSQLPAIRTESH